MKEDDQREREREREEKMRGIAEARRGEAKRGKLGIGIEMKGFVRWVGGMYKGRKCLGMMRRKGERNHIKGSILFFGVWLCFHSCLGFPLKSKLINTKSLMAVLYILRMHLKYSHSPPQKKGESK